MALILADHSVSAEKHFHANQIAYANTDRQTGRMNQGLDWHLEHVGRSAGDMVFNLLNLAPPCLSGDAVERICQPSSGRFAWQNRAAAALSRSVDRAAIPHLVFNMAGTGSGKTRMNMRAACVLAQGEVRVATALNLRTLTLQTADAYSQQLRIGRDEMACVIGDQVAAALHETARPRARYGAERFADDDENVFEPDPDAVSDFEYGDAPEWLAHFLHGKPKLASIIGAPVLVSTVDFLIAAGEPQRQANHALAALRMMTSDLILDEIDGYDPLALMSVLRLVMTAGLFGRNVIASSATLSRPVARLLWQAFDAGIRMRARLEGKAARFSCALIDDLAEPAVITPETAERFQVAYQAHLDAMLPKLIGRRHRLAELQPVPARCSKNAWRQVVLDAAKSLHERHGWVDPGTGIRLSFGLIRMANITPAIGLAHFIARNDPTARVACYHARHFRMQRAHIERRLDSLLTRHSGNQHILGDSDIRDLLNQCKAAGGTELRFIVVATPVEEIGRDHDFDWAVIEPSSVQSIVQTAGRVNRHRLIDVTSPNIAILQFNFSAAVKGKETAFVRPGLEVGDTRYDTHDLGELLDWRIIEQIDARLRFDDTHAFARLDDNSIAEQTAGHLGRLVGSDAYAHLWMSDWTYLSTPLRTRDGTPIELMLETDPDASPDSYQLYIDNERIVQSSNLTRYQRAANDWLVRDDDELIDKANNEGIAPDAAMTVTMSMHGILENPSLLSGIQRHRSFGFYIDRT
jgi:CRISPR-associated endonuclease/helicase Cas3